MGGALSSILGGTEVNVQALKNDWNSKVQYCKDHQEELLKQYSLLSLDDPQARVIRSALDSNADNMARFLILLQKLSHAVGQTALQTADSVTITVFENKSVSVPRP